MQKHFFTVLAASFFAAVLFSSCSKKNSQGRHIPAGAGVVFHINGKSLNEKLPWDEVKQNDLFKEMMADTSLPAYVKAILNNPDSSGVDIKSDFEIFLVKDSAGGYAAVEGGLKDQAKFKSFLTVATVAATEKKETSKDDQAYLTTDKACVGSNKDMFILTINLPQMNMANAMRNRQFSTDTTFGGMDEVKYDRDMAALTASLFNLSEDKSLAKDDHFSELMKNTGDGHAWISAENLNMANGLGGMGAMINTDKLIKGAVTTGTVNFENGKINFDMKSYGSKELNELYSKYNGGNFDKSMVQNIPSKNLAGMFILNFKPEGIREFLKMMSLDGLANMGLSKMGFTMDDFIKANKGDIMFAVTDVTMDTGMVRKPSAQVLFSASIGDKASFNKLIDAGKMIGKMKQVDDAEPKIFYNTNDKYFVLSNNLNASNTYLAGTANSSYSFLDKITGNPIGGYVNIQYLMSALKPAEGRDSLDVAAYDASVKLWDNILISGGNFKDGGISQHWEINFMDKNTNSLKQLNTYAGVMGTIEKKRKAKEKDMWDMPEKDSTVMIHPDAVAPVEEAH